ncbi:spore germination protein GerA [Bacillus sp. UMTAT18]|nr:spore germination protein GerA [Bacillus sp. UMTAT18]KYQ03048.1 Spore germination protein GerYA [Bacillus cereus]COF62751.1 Bacillus/Clostridium GerA spore germination protein [Streptococcus pneumoniae]COK25141.1 Bacillus/Clostridium GerA spore germination protein [Streptococcus pneumoniae]SMD64247.1 Spore germination protein A1 [Bacillus cereus]
MIIKKSSDKNIKKTDEKSSSNMHSIEDLLEKAKKSHDFYQTQLTKTEGYLLISYYTSIIDQKKLEEHIFPIFRAPFYQSNNIKNINDIQKIIPIEDIIITDDIGCIKSKLMTGYAIIQITEKDKCCALVNISNTNAGMRVQNNVENEYSVIGPRIGFIEDITTNLNLLRQTVNTPDLIFKEIHIGTISNTKVVVAYIDGVTNDDYVQTMIQRLEAINYDVVFDSSQLHQIIEDNSNSPFPLLLPTERIDKAAFSLVNGQVVVFNHGSSYAITGPSTLLDFFTSPEDYYFPWVLASFFRVIRILSVLFSIFATPIYIAVLTYHSEMIPRVLLSTLGFSRHNVPFPPVLEVIFLELTIELLREAGARLPTKVGQTLGIVGGIVIGQASVEAGLTSNVLLIIVALAALASFTTPNYKMSNNIRFLRFPLIFFSAVWGGLGIVIGICFILTHITRLESLGAPYTVPLYPLRVKDYSDTFLRLPLNKTEKRKTYLRPKSIWRYHPNPERKKKNDFDE